MIDVIGVGICIVCISYLCCIYTTAFMLQPPSKCADRSRNPEKRKPVVIVESSPPSRHQKRRTRSRSSATSFVTTSSLSSSTSRRKCRTSCSDGSPAIVKTMPCRRKICLIADSFLDVDDVTDDTSAGDCKRSIERLTTTGPVYKCSIGTLSRRKESRQTVCRN